MPRILVTGGAGYIGSHTALRLVEAGHDVVVLDDLSTGHAAAVPDDATMVKADLADVDAVRGTLRDLEPDAVVHFAARIEPALSMTEPRAFYRANVVNSANLLDALLDTRPVPVVLSSTCAVYGEPERLPLTEDQPFNPLSVYGETKAVVERMFDAYEAAYGTRSIRLRYFNACGAHHSGRLGPDHRVKVHLITLALLAALGQRPTVKVFGTDYPTPDGTCIRDYIHVEDLAEAHVASIDALLAGAPTAAYNVGVGRGFSVREVLDAVDRVVGRPVPREEAPRRPGDPARLWAEPTRIRTGLGWEPRYTDIDEIVASQWRWHSSHPHGFAS